MEAGCIPHQSFLGLGVPLTGTQQLQCHRLPTCCSLLFPLRPFTTAVMILLPFLFLFAPFLHDHVAVKQMVFGMVSNPQRENVPQGTETVPKIPLN